MVTLIEVFVDGGVHRQEQKAVNEVIEGDAKESDPQVVVVVVPNDLVSDGVHFGIKERVLPKIKSGK